MGSQPKADPPPAENPYGRTNSNHKFQILKIKQAQMTKFKIRNIIVSFVILNLEFVYWTSLEKFICDLEIVFWNFNIR